MATDVRQIVLRILQTRGGQSQAQAQATLDQLQRAQRYQQDVWS